MQTFSFNDNKVLRSNYESVELIADEQCVYLDVLFYQQDDPDNYAQLCVKLEKTSSPPSSLLLINGLRQQMHLQQIEALMVGLYKEVIY